VSVQSEMPPANYVPVSLEPDYCSSSSDSDEDDDVDVRNFDPTLMEDKQFGYHTV